MTFFALGVNHHTASVELRERVAFNAERLQQVLSVQKQSSFLNELVIVSTCNRTELYAIAERSEILLNWFAEVNGIDVHELFNHVYTYEDMNAVAHLMRVSSGLDSLMLGEPQILGQVKSAFALAKDVGTISSELNKIFEYAFYATKRVRSETSVGNHAVSMGYAVAQLAHQVFSHPHQLIVLIVAAGEMNTLVAKHMADIGVGKILICNRGVERAERLAGELIEHANVEIIPFDELAQNLYRADIISSCTGSLHHIIEYNDVKQALKKRRYQQMLLVDLAVPRDIEPKVEQLDGVYLYGVDDLQTVIDENLAQRRQAAVEAEVLVSQLTAQLATQKKVHQAGQTISAYRDIGHQTQQLELDVAKRELEEGKDPLEVLHAFSHRLTQKLLHPTSILLRDAAQADEPEYLQWLEDELELIIEKQRKLRK